MSRPLELNRPLEEIESITEKVIGHAIDVHRELGPGLLESLYRECLVIELTDARLTVATNLAVPVQYKGRRVRAELKLDLLVEGCVVVELKAVDRMNPVYLAQVITYLKLTGHPAGLLMNFNDATLRARLRRLYHPDLFVSAGGRPTHSRSTRNEP